MLFGDSLLLGVAIKLLLENLLSANDPLWPASALLLAAVRFRHLMTARLQEQWLWAPDH
jgi:hypothetical protein